MKKFISIRSEYYKTSKADGLIAHIQRNFEINKNVLDEKYIKFPNLSSIDNNFEKLKKEAKKDFEDNTNQSFNRIKNLYVETVVNFSQEHFFQVYENNQEMIIKNIEALIKKIEEEFGIKSAGWSLHLDEGHIKDGKPVYNPHFHISWVNYNFEEHRTKWRNLKKKDFVKFQDLAAASFENLGFERGISKDITNTNHLKKDEFIKHKQNKEMKNILTIEELFERLESGNISIKKVEEAKIFYKDNKMMKRVLNAIYTILNTTLQKENNIEELNKKMKLLRKNVEKLEDKEKLIISLQEEEETLNESIDTLKSKEEALRANIDDLKTDLKQKYEQKEEFDEIEEENQRLREENQEQKERINILENSLKYIRETLISDAKNSKIFQILKKNLPFLKLDKGKDIDINLE